MKMNVDVVLSKEEVEKVVNSNENKSNKMRLLFKGGIEVKEISNLMGVRYNFVYNVVSNMLLEGKVNSEDIIKNSARGNNNSNELKEKIRELKKEGYRIIDIAKELKINYNKCKGFFDNV